MSSSATDAAKQNWAFQIKRSSLPRLLPLRLDPDLEIAELPDGLFWVRGTGVGTERYQILAAVSDSPIFLLDEQQRLTPSAGTVPTGRLPALSWSSLTEFITATPPRPRRIRDSQLRIEVRLCRSGQIQDAAAMITSWKNFLEWGLAISELRLKSLKFAVAGQRVLVIGQPIPPLTGQRFWVAGQLYVPLGYSWQPAIDEASLNESLSLLFAQSHPENQHVKANNVLFVWHEDTEQIEPVQLDDLSPVSRSTLRQTAIGLSDTSEFTETSGESRSDS